MRARALDVLMEIEARRGFASDLLKPGEGRLARELVFGVQRRRLTLDTVQDAYGSRKTDALDPQVRAAIRIGLYQLLFMDGVPVYAAVGETVGAVEEKVLRGYINAVLRRVSRELTKISAADAPCDTQVRRRLDRGNGGAVVFERDVFPDPVEKRCDYLARTYSHPHLLVERWVQRFGEEPAIVRMAGANQTPPTMLRPRAGRIDAATLVERLRQDGIDCRVVEREPGSDGVEVAPGSAAPFNTSAFAEGLFSVQSFEQMDAVEILDIRPGEVVWDACCAPGGKLGQLAERAGGEARIVATDKDERRLARVRETVSRLGLEEVTVGCHDVLSGEPPPGKPGRGFDAILLDAPCSNTAVLCSRPEARWRLREETFARLAKQQDAMIASARAHLAPNGRLIYSVCSLEPEEGEQHGLQATRSPLVWRWTSTG